MSDYPMLISNKLHSFRNFVLQKYKKRLLFVSDQPFSFVAVISFLSNRECIFGLLSYSLLSSIQVTYMFFYKIISSEILYIRFFL